MSAVLAVFQVLLLAWAVVSLLAVAWVVVSVFRARPAREPRREQRVGSYWPRGTA